MLLFVQALNCRPYLCALVCDSSLPRCDLSDALHGPYGARLRFQVRAILVLLGERNDVVRRIPGMEYVTQDLRRRSGMLRPGSRSNRV
jgi:hypothetical protein